MILDTNALSAFFEGIPAVVSRMSEARQVALPIIVLGEYRYDLRGSKLRRKLEAHLIAFSRTVEVLPVREPTTRFYADIRQELKTAGRPIPENDIWIAALAREYGFPILSQDVHFDAVTNLRRIGW